MTQFEQEIPGSGGQSIGRIGFDMECDGTKEYVRKMYQKTKLEQVIEFYGIPWIYKNDYKKFLKYRIQPRHYDIVQNHFLLVLRDEGYETDDFDFGKLQEEYNMRVPTAEQTALNLHVNYDEFLQKEAKHNAAINREDTVVRDDTILQMQSMMQQMMEEMKELKQMSGKAVPLLSKSNENEGKDLQESTIQTPGEIGEAPGVETGRNDSDTDGGLQHDSNGDQGTELINSGTVDGEIDEGLKGNIFITTKGSVDSGGDTNNGDKKDRRTA